MTGLDYNDELFTSAGVQLDFQWDAGADLSAREITNVWVRLMVSDGKTNSGFATNLVSFEVDTRQPSAVVCIVPVYGITNYKQKIKLQASASTDANALLYQFQIADNPDFKSAVESDWLSSPTWIANNLEWDKTYYWRVIVKDSFGNESAYSTPRMFYNKFPLVDFSKYNLRIIPNYVGPNDKKEVKIFLKVKGENPETLYRVMVLNLSGQRIVRDFGKLPYSELNNGYIWDLTDKNGKLLSSGVYTVSVKMENYCQAGYILCL